MMAWGTPVGKDEGRRVVVDSGELRCMAGQRAVSMQQEQCAAAYAEGRRKRARRRPLLTCGGGLAIEQVGGTVRRAAADGAGSLQRACRAALCAAAVMVQGVRAAAAGRHRVRLCRARLAAAGPAAAPASTPVGVLRRW